MTDDVLKRVPTLGRTVIYTLSGEDAVQINRRRTSSGSIADRIKIEQWPLGAQGHIGNQVSALDRFPMVIVRVWGTEPSSAVNGQVFLDGNDVFWATSVSCGDGPRTWQWPDLVHA